MPRPAVPQPDSELTPLAGWGRSEGDLPGEFTQP